MTTDSLLRTTLLVFSSATVFQSTLSAQSPGPRYQHYANSLAPYVVSPQDVVEKMLALADLRPGEVVYDLGSGDGRVLVTAVRQFHARAVGIEISDSLVEATNATIRRLGLEKQARVIHADFMTVDLSPADVVTLYLMTDANAKLRPRLERYLHAGARVVSHDYPVPGWSPRRVEPAERSDKHFIYLYELPDAKK